MKLQVTIKYIICNQNGGQEKAECFRAVLDNRSETSNLCQPSVLKWMCLFPTAGLGQDPTLCHWKSRFNTTIVHIVLLKVDAHSWWNRELQQPSHRDTLCWSMQCLQQFLSALFNTSAALNKWRISSFPTVRWWWHQFCSSIALTKKATSKTSLYLKPTYTQVMSRKETQTKHGWQQIQEDDILKGQAKH